MKKEYLEYLEKLRQMGIRTILGAAIYLEKEFNMTHIEAKKLINEYNRKNGFYE